MIYQQLPTGPRRFRSAWQHRQWSDAPIAGQATSTRRRTQVWVACALLAAVVAIQLAIGAYGAELGNESDEAAHFMNGLLVRDYLRTGLGTNPMRFAESYYISYPKIAPLMWPPLFHVTLGLFLLPGWPPHGAALALIAIFIAWTAWRLYTMARIVSSPLAAAVVAILFVLTTDVVRSSSTVMLDIVVAAFALEASYWLALYVDDNNWRHAVAFGIAAACACLTKPNGIAVIFMPPIVAALSRRFELLWRRGLFVAAAIVLIFAVPFVSLAFRLDAAIGDFGPVATSEIAARLALYGRYVRDQMGVVPLGFALVGAADVVWRRGARCSDRSRSMAEALVALTVAAFAFHLISPHHMAAGRYMMLALPPLFGLAALAIDRIVAWMHAPNWDDTLKAAVLGVFALAFLMAKPGLAAVRPLGFNDAVEALESHGGLAGRRILVVSDEAGEGAFVSSTAIRGAKPAPIVIRGSKLLASGDWMDHDFRLLFASPAAIEQELEDLHVDYLVLDSSDDGRRQRFWKQVDEMITDYGDRLEPLAEAPRTAPRLASRPIAIYRLTHWSPGSAKRVRVNLKYSLGRTVE